MLRIKAARTHARAVRHGLPRITGARGFIGPIGDDLPSLVPLLFALVIFFSTFSFAFGVFDKRSRGFQDDLKALQLAHALKANGYIGSADEFGEHCASLGISGLKYRAVVTNVYALSGRARPVQGTGQGAGPGAEETEASAGETPAQAQLDIYGLAPFHLAGANPDDEGMLECTNSGEPLTMEKAVDSTVVVKVYPVAVEDNLIVKPMHLVVIAWR